MRGLDDKARLKIIEREFKGEGLWVEYMWLCNKTIIRKLASVK